MGGSLPVFQITPVAGAISSDHCLFIYRVEVQPGLPLLLGLRQYGQGHDGSCRQGSIDWLHSTTCRVLAFMGGEPLLRPQLVHKASYYAAKKGFWIYMPTNARLLRPDVIDRLADAGVAIFNFAVDGVDEKPGLPKALNPIREYFDYLIRKQYKYGYAVFFNINICRNNIEDVKQLTEIAANTASPRIMTSTNRP